ncbi:hypothetical protein CEP53_015250 [Fusarium sp. AF-6]|nr:hypothetical protein CEP53_015250 [Fusarium sp. AF-6]
MYRGMGPLLLGYLPTWAIWFTVYQHSKVTLPQSYPHLSSRPNAVNILSSIAAGTASTVVTNPIWTVKVRLMSQAYRPCRSRLFRKRRIYRPHWHYHSTLDAAYKMYTTEGMGAFYSGLGAALLGLSHVAVQFPTYEYLKTKFTGKGMGASRDDEAEWVSILSASVLSKIAASGVTYPHEVIRTRLQTQRRPVPGAEFLEGLGGFTRLRASNRDNHKITHAAKDIECAGCYRLFVSNSAMVLHLEAGTCPSEADNQTIHELAFECRQSQYYYCDDPEYDYECPTFLWQFFFDSSERVFKMEQDVALSGHEE